MAIRGGQVDGHPRWSAGRAVPMLTIVHAHSTGKWIESDQGRETIETCQKEENQF